MFDNLVTGPGAISDFSLSKILSLREYFKSFDISEVVSRISRKSLHCLTEADAAKLRACPYQWRNMALLFSSRNLAAVPFLDPAMMEVPSWHCLGQRLMLTFRRINISFNTANTMTALIDSTLKRPNKIFMGFKIIAHPAKTDSYLFPITGVYMP